MPRRRRRKSSNIAGLVIIGLFLALLASTPSPYRTLWLVLALLFFIGPLMVIIPRFISRWRLVNRFRALKLDDVDSMDGHQFEHYVARLLKHQGFRTTVTKGSGDLGVDIIADRGGVRYCIQCKRYGKPVPRTAISDAVGAKARYQCSQAMVVTNSYFTPGALELAQANRCILIDRNQLGTWVRNFQRSATAGLPQGS